MIPAGFVFLALAFNCVGAGLYLYRLLRHEIRPHIITWTLWAVAPYVAFFAQLSDDIGLHSLITLFTGTSPLLVVIILLIRREAEWGITKLDLICGALSGTGIIAWVHTRHAEYAVIFAILSDAFASLPTYRKAWHDPQSELWTNYCCLMISALIALATVRTWSLLNYAFAGYLAVLGASLTAIILLREGRVAANRPA